MRNDYETMIAMLKANLTDDSCSRLEGVALTDFMAQLSPNVVRRFIEEYRKRSAIVRGYELPKGCAEMLPPECFSKKDIRSRNRDRTAVKSTEPPAYVSGVQLPAEGQ